MTGAGTQRALWSPALRDIEPYTPGEQPRIPGLVKLNTNENPYPPSPRVLEAIAAAASEGLQLYPDPTATALREAVARHHGIDAGQVFAGNGSDEVLAHAFFAFFRHGKPLLVADVTYSFYRVYCALYGIEPRLVPLRDDFAIDVADYAGVDACGVVIANPNAPTGMALGIGDIERLLEANRGCVVLVDEAYVDFGGESAIRLVERHPNLLVVQTLSKSRSLAGLRVGIAVGQRGLIEALERVKDSFNSYPLGRLAIAGAAAAYEDTAWFERCRDQVVAERERLVPRLEALGFRVLPSRANFVFATHPAHDAARLAQGLRERAVLVRHFRQPRIDRFLRITVGTPGQRDRLVDALEAVLAQ